MELIEVYYVRFGSLNRRKLHVVLIKLEKKIW